MLWGQENGSSINKDDLLLGCNYDFGEDIRDQDAFSQLNVDKQILERVDTLLNTK